MPVRSQPSVRLPQNPADERWQRILTMQRRLGSENIALSDELNQSEQTTNFHNRAYPGCFMRLRISIVTRWRPVMYTRQCSTLLTTKELATMGATLAGHGKTR